MKVHSDDQYSDTQQPAAQVWTDRPLHVSRSRRLLHADPALLGVRYLHLQRPWPGEWPPCSRRRRRSPLTSLLLPGRLASCVVPRAAMRWADSGTVLRLRRRRRRRLWTTGRQTHHTRCVVVKYITVQCSYSAPCCTILLIRCTNSSGIRHIEHKTINLGFVYIHLYSPIHVCYAVYVCYCPVC